MRGSLIALLLMFAPAAALADAAPAPAVVVDATVLAPASAPPPATEANPLHDKLADPGKEVTTGDVVDASKDAVAAVEAAIDNPTKLGIFGAIAAVLWAILAGIRRFGSGSMKGSTIRLITLIITPVATFAGTMAVDVGWFDALVLSAGGPGALLLNEVLRLLGLVKTKPKDAAPAG